MQRRLVECLVRRGDVQRRILREEAVGSQHHADALHRHDGEVFDTGVVGETEGCFRLDPIVRNRGGGI